MSTTFDGAPQANPWYAPKPTNVQPPITYSQPMLSQFVWVNNPGVVEMYPMGPKSEMVFIDGQSMKLYIRNTDEYNHPLKTKRFRLVEETDEEVKATVEPVAPAINIEELKTFLSEEVNKAVNSRMNNLFNFTPVAQANAMTNSTEMNGNV